MISSTIILSYLSELFVQTNIPWPWLGQLVAWSQPVRSFYVLHNTARDSCLRAEAKRAKRWKRKTFAMDPEATIAVYCNYQDILKYWQYLICTCILIATCNMSHSIPICAVAARLAGFAEDSEDVDFPNGTSCLWNSTVMAIYQL